MTLTDDTHPADETRTVPPGYPHGVSVSDDPTKAAKAAIRAIERAEERLRLLRLDRDAAVRRMHAEQGVKPPAIGRTLGMSTSNVRLALARRDRVA